MYKEELWKVGGTNRRETERWREER